MPLGLAVQPGVVPMDRTTAGAVLLITMIITIGVVVLLLLIIIGDLIDMEVEGTSGIGITAVASTIVIATDLRSAIAEEDGTSATEAPSMAVAETITTETVAGRGIDTMTGGVGNAAPMATMVEVGAGVATVLAAGRDLVRPATAAAPMVANESTVEMRAAVLIGANLVGDPVAAVLLRPAHLLFLSQDSRSTALLGVPRLGALPHLRGSNLWERESLLLLLLQ
jgi:hypothetical protein